MNYDLTTQLNMPTAVLRELQDTISNQTGDYQTSEFFPCTHSQTIKHKNKLNCYSCGILLQENGVRSYKSQKMRYGAYFNPSRYLTSALKSRIPKIVVLPDSDFSKSRTNLIELVAEISQKLRVTPNTMHLGVFFMDLVLSRVSTISTQLYPVYAATAVMLAAKSIELDERVPFVSKLQRYSGLTQFKPREFLAAEQAILRELNWNMQCVTSIDVMEYYLSQGVVFSTDTIIDSDSSANSEIMTTSTSVASSSSNILNALRDMSNIVDNTSQTPSGQQALTGKASTKGQMMSSISAVELKDFTSAFNALQIGQKENNPISMTTSITQQKKQTISDLSDETIYSIVAKIEKDYIKLSNLIIRDNRFYDFDMRILSAAGICFLRKISGITSGWTNQLVEISNNLVSQSQLDECISIIEHRYQYLFAPSPLKQQQQQHQQPLQQLQQIPSQVKRSNSSVISSNTFSSIMQSVSQMQSSVSTTINISQKPPSSQPQQQQQQSYLQPPLPLQLSVRNNIPTYPSTVANTSKTGSLMTSSTSLISNIENISLKHTTSCNTALGSSTTNNSITSAKLLPFSSTRGIENNENGFNFSTLTSNNAINNNNNGGYQTNKHIASNYSSNNFQFYSQSAQASANNSNNNSTSNLSTLNLQMYSSTSAATSGSQSQALTNCNLANAPSLTSSQSQSSTLQPLLPQLSSQQASSGFIRSNVHHHSAFQPSQYLGLTRFGSNIL